MVKPIAVLIDLSGTIHVDTEVLPGVAEGLARLRESNVPHLFLSNTTKESKTSLLKKLQDAGLEIPEEKVYTSLTACAEWVEANGKENPLLLLSEDAQKDFAHLKKDRSDGADKNYDAVVMGLAPDEFHYERLTEAMRALLEPEVPLIAAHQGRYFKRPDGLALGPGAIIKGLEFSTGKQAETLGKPSEPFFNRALVSLGVSGGTSNKETLQSVYMIGDDARDDIAGARRLGMRGVLVRTGKYRPGDETKEEHPPDHTADAFNEAVEWILQN
eukprot:Clim_evm6s18 gene=Clim_evmTU6s18